MPDISYFLLSNKNAPRSLPAPSTTEPVAFNSMLMHLDRLCEALGDTLREVVVATFCQESDRWQVHTVNTMYELRNQMPFMAKQQRLSFRMSRWTYRELRSSGRHDTVLKNVFERDGGCWENVVLDD